MDQLNVKIYADGAKLEDMLAAYKSGFVSGFTTNPSLMKKAGVADYVAFAKKVVEKIPDLPLSFEVFADDFETMEKEAEKIHTFGKNVYIKIPITNTKGESSIPLIEKLQDKGYSLNVTAILTIKQVEETVAALNPDVDNIVSVFAGRIADTGRDPIPYMKQSVDICRTKKGANLLWASSRELFNVYEADRLGVDIITCTPEIISKLKKVGKPLEQVSLDTVKGFNTDIQTLGYTILTDKETSESVSK
ncbi:transaldolase [Sporolactobacillus terrae]|uniref:Transaldolase n=1 Tax=Sporolactobacillus terrae TaxID=269673 RepID=A0A410D6X1_9BACL|nr:transaldolase [Sporolactobacillus terrae]QAA21858.1 transaldolase [Sporolactobacillus terrae]QAA24831.1 transaldolase [Sporolactobacillus terrae]UAK16655.1 transaldolase [Sporolactobacillus terrae]BBN98131.1 transaldolase [Sporolactobacillus terrae]